MSPTSRVPLAIAAFTAAAAGAAAFFPVQFSVTAVFVLAGPHNWMEARYFLERMPARWGRARSFYFIAIAGVVALSPTFAWIVVYRPLWHSAAALWLLALVRVARRKDFDAALPIAFLWMAWAWVAPSLADLTLVYLHPLIAILFAWRQISHSRAQWLWPLRLILASLIPLGAATLWIAPSRLPSGWSGAALGISPIPGSASAIALHAFLEMLHYGVWVFLLPAIGLASAPWDFKGVALARLLGGGTRILTAFFSIAVACVVLLWVCFALDYSTTYDVYFTVAIVHVLAEAPFLVRLK